MHLDRFADAVENHNVPTLMYREYWAVPAPPRQHQSVHTAGADGYPEACFLPIQPPDTHITQPMPATPHNASDNIPPTLLALAASTLGGAISPYYLLLYLSIFPVVITLQARKF